MGNYTSRCCLPHSSHKTKIIDSNGNLRRVNLPVKVAEVMIEEPGHIISPVDDLLTTHRISAMRADDELLAGKVYMLVPVVRVNCKVKEEELAIIKAANCDRRRLKKKKRSGAKVLPAVSEDVTDEIQDEVTVSGGSDTGFSCYRSRHHNKQWSPVLEAISEVC